MQTAWTDGVLQYSYIKPTELEEITAMLAKPSVCEHVYFGPNSPEETRAYFMPLIEPIQASLERDELPDNHVFTIRDARDSTFVGECALMPVMFGDGNYTIGYQFDEPYWGRGYGTRACEFILWYGFRTLGARRLSGDTLGSNVGSARIMEKCGFKREGSLLLGETTRGARLGSGALSSFGSLKCVLVRTTTSCLAYFERSSRSTSRNWRRAFVLRLADRRVHYERVSSSWFVANCFVSTRQSKTGQALEPLSPQSADYTA